MKQMKTNNLQNAPKVRLGDYIEIYEVRNRTGENFPFCGINKNKEFISTVANTNELDNTKYKVVTNNMFVFSGMQTGRDVCIRLALYQEDDSILVSPAYTTFIIKNEEKLLPQFLFLFFFRFEMDRYGCFLSDGSIRSNLDWNRFCDIQIPLPSIDTQKELVAVYNGLQKIALKNEALIKPLEESCHAFVANCKEKYKSVRLGDYIEECDKRNTDGKLTLDDVRGISTEKTFIDTKANMTGVSLSSYKVISSKEFVYVSDTSRRGDKIALALNRSEKPILVSSIYSVFRSINENILLPEYLFLLLCRTEFDRYSRFNSWGSARETFDFSELQRVQIPLPPKEIQQSIVSVYNCLEETKRIARTARELMKNLCPALIQKAAHSV